MDEIQKVTISVECESCDGTYRYDVPINIISKQKYSYWDYGDRKQVSGTKFDYAGNVDEIVRNYVRKCPKCGYIQSWMQEPALKQRRAGVGLLPILLAAAVGLIFQFSDYISNSFAEGLCIFMGICVLIGGLGFSKVWDFLLIPNKNHPPTNKVRKPYYHL